MSPLNARASAHQPERAASDFATRVAVGGDEAWLTAARMAFYQTQIAAGWLDLPSNLDEWVAQGTGGIIRGPRNCVLVAERGGALAGYVFGAAKIVPGARKPVIASIEEMYVAPDHRGAGLARQLFGTALTAFNAKGADRIQLRVLADNAAGRALWSGLGFRDNVVICELSPARRDGSVPQTSDL